MNTQLKDRTLWFDGTNQVNPDLVPQLLLLGVPPNKIVVNEQNDDIIKFNSLEDIRIKSSKDENEKFDFSWNVPKEYLDIDLSVFLGKKLKEFMSSVNPDFEDVYSTRLDEELEEIRNRNLDYLFKTIIFIVDKFRSEKIIWGVGRGSSCASLVLFIIGLHRVDPIKFKIPSSEFFHD